LPHIGFKLINSSILTGLKIVSPKKGDEAVEEPNQENEEIKLEEAKEEAVQESNLKENIADAIQIEQNNSNMKSDTIEKRLNNKNTLRNFLEEKDIENPLFLRDKIDNGPDFKFIPKQVFEHSEEGTVVAKIFIGNLPAGATFALDNKRCHLGKGSSLLRNP